MVLDWCRVLRGWTCVGSPPSRHRRRGEHGHRRRAPSRPHPNRSRGSPR
nr:MAG TPA: hypothetical protein [Caudoviricetes sp.]